MERTSTSSLWGAGLAAERPSRFSAASVDRDPTPAVRKLRNARLLVAGSGLISVTFLTTLTSLTIMDYHLLIKEIPGSKSTALAAAVLDPFSLVALIFLIAFNLMTPGQGWTTRVVLPLSGALVAVAGACLSLSAMLIESSETKKSSQKHTAASDFSVKIGVWIIALLSQLAFYSLVLLGRHLTDASQTKLASRRPLAHEEKGARIAPKRPPTPPSPLRMVAPPYALPQASASFIEPEPESRRSSWRKSLHNIQQAVRPISLKSSLGRPAWARHCAIQPAHPEIRSCLLAPLAHPMRLRTGTYRPLTRSFGTPSSTRCPRDLAGPHWSRSQEAVLSAWRDRLTGRSRCCPLQRRRGRQNQAIVPIRAALPCRAGNDRPPTTLTSTLSPQRIPSVGLRALFPWNRTSTLYSAATVPCHRRPRLQELPSQRRRSAGASSWRPRAHRAVRACRPSDAPPASKILREPRAAAAPA